MFSLVVDNDSDTSSPAAVTDCAVEPAVGFACIGQIGPGHRGSASNPFLLLRVWRQSENVRLPSGLQAGHRDRASQPPGSSCCRRQRSDLSSFLCTIPIVLSLSSLAALSRPTSQKVC